MSTNPYLITGPALVSFSMGRTSGYLLWKILQSHGGQLPHDVHVVTANTGKEAPESLNFWEEIRVRWNVPMVMLEFDPSEPHGTKIVDHNSASRNGEPLKAAIDTRPTQHLFNPVSRYCTATAKLRRLQKYMHKIQGYDAWTSVIGIRADEPRRVESNRSRSGIDRQTIAMPLADAGVVKADIWSFWKDQPFDLQLPYDEVSGETVLGNCAGCVAKARWKILSELRRRPEEADWWIEQEDEMERRIQYIPRTNTDAPDRRHRFFKDGTSFRELKAYALSDKPIIRSSRHGGGSVDCACTD